MQSVLKNRIVKLYEDFTELTGISRTKDKELTSYKKNFGKSMDIEKSVEEFSNLVSDFTLITRDCQLIFTELIILIRLYKDLNFNDMPKEVLEFYGKNEIHFPKTLFVVKEGGIVEKEEGSLQAERDKFLKSDYLKNLINSNTE